jgi:NifU-like protein involved in Fe-S cluster formation
MSGYVNGQVLVETGWVAEHLTDPNVRIVECDEDVLLDLIDALGREIVTQRTRCATLSLDTLRAALRQRERQQRVETL